MPAQLSPLDTAFLELEDADDAAHMHIGWAMVFEPLADGGPPSLDALRAQTDERLDLLPRFRLRLSSPRVGALSWPSWEPDTDFDIANHMRRAALPSPGGEAELMEWLGDFYSHRLDRTRPLWEITLLDGLAGGRWALATKAHHCLVDGVSGASVAVALLDAEPEPPAGSAGLAALAAPAAEEPPEDGALARLQAALGTGLETVAHPRRLGAALSRSRAMAELLIRDELVGAPHTSLNEAIGARRRLGAVDVPLDRLKEIKNALGGHLNDVVLAAVAGGLRELLEHRGELDGIDRVRAMVPVNLRSPEESLSLGNRVSSLFVELPLAEPDALLRYRKTVASSSALKRGGQSAGAETLIDLAGIAPPAVHGIVARLAFKPRLFNVTITNVPGPQATLYGLGAPMRRVIPLVPIFSGHAIGIAVVSYDGNVVFGLNADRPTVPDLEAMQAGIERSLADLGAAAGAAAVS